MNKLNKCQFFVCLLFSCAPFLWAAQDVTFDKGSLHWAAQAGELDALNQSIKNGSSPNSLGPMGFGALHWAAREGHAAIVKSLLEHGANPDLKALGTSWVPLFEAAERGHILVAHTLLQGGADLHALNAEGQGALHIAIASAQSDMALALLDMGASPNALDSTHQSPLFAAARAGLADVSKALLDRGVDLNTPTLDGWTPLMVAAREGFAPITSMLLEVGAKPGLTRGYYKRTPLHWACAGGHIDTVREFLKRGFFKFGTKDRTGETPLSLAAFSGSYYLVELLVRYGAKPQSWRDADGNSLLHRLAMASTHMLPGDSTAKDAARALDVLIRAGLDVDVTNNLSQTPLYKAARYGNVLAVQALIDAGANPNWVDDISNTALYEAVHRGHLEVVKILVQAPGIDVNDYGAGGMAPLHLAAGEGLTDIAAVLLEAGADPTKLSSQDGKPPIYYAIENQHPDTIRVLAEFSGTKRRYHRSTL